MQNLLVKILFKEDGTVNLEGVETLLDLSDYKDEQQKEKVARAYAFDLVSRTTLPYEFMDRFLPDLNLMQVLRHSTVSKELLNKYFKTTLTSILKQMVEEGELSLLRLLLQQEYDKEMKTSIVLSTIEALSKTEEYYKQLEALDTYNAINERFTEQLITLVLDNLGEFHSSLYFALNVPIYLEAYVQGYVTEEEMIANFERMDIMTLSTFLYEVLSSQDEMTEEDFREAFPLEKQVFIQGLMRAFSYTSKEDQIKELQTLLERQ